MKLTIIILMFPVVIALLTLSECSTEAQEQPVEENLASMKGVSYRPGHAEFTVWNLISEGER